MIFIFNDLRHCFKVATHKSEQTFNIEDLTYQTIGTTCCFLIRIKSNSKTLYKITLTESINLFLHLL